MSYIFICKLAKGPIALTTEANTVTDALVAFRGELESFGIAPTDEEFQAALDDKIYHLHVVNAIQSVDSTLYV